MYFEGTSLVVQQLIHVPMQEAQIRFLIRELDPICCNHDLTCYNEDPAQLSKQMFF